MLVTTRSHTGRTELDLSAVRAMPEPASLGPRHRPIHHAEVIDTVSRTLAVEPTKISVQGKNGGLMFAEFRCADRNILGIDYSETFTVLNDHEQRFSLRSFAGGQVWACTNGLLFTDGVLESARRKHSAPDASQYSEFLRSCVESARGAWLNQAEKLQRLAERPLSDAEAFELFARWYLAGQTTSGALGRAVEVWNKPTHAEFSERNGFSWYNCANEAAKKLAPLSQPRALTSAGAVILN